MIGHIRKISCLLALGILLSSTALAKTVSTVDVGGTKFYIPIPQGYVDGATAAPAVHQIFANMTATGTAALKTSFIKDSDVKRYFTEGGTNLESYYGIMTIKKAESLQTSQAQFDKLRHGLADLQQGLAAKLGPRLAEVFDQVNKKDIVAPGVKLAIKPGEIISLGVEENTPTTIIYTTLTSFSDLNEPDQAPKTLITVSAVMYIKQKILMVVLYKNFAATKDISQAKAELKTLVRSVSTTNH